MPKFLAKHPAPVDVLVLGDHPAAYLAGALLRQKSKLRILHAALAVVESNHHLTTLNPALFDLHPFLSGLRSSLESVAVHGLQFLSDHVETRSEYRAKSAVVRVCRFEQVRDLLNRLAESEGVEFLGTQSLQIHRVDEHGLEITLGKHALKPLAFIVACELGPDHMSMLGIPDAWEPEVLHRFTTARCRTAKHLNLAGKTLMPMSLDLQGKLCWGWLIPGDGEFQLAIEEPLADATQQSGIELLRHWVRILQLHGVLGPKFEISPSSVSTSQLPLAGALAHEGVANRTLLIGPAGGFFSACGEEIYPCCWSALFAADVMKKALKERHLQDALNPFRQKWRATLGDYLRGPQQNLRFLLPLVYRNPAMTARLAEAILLSKSVVR